MKRSRLRRSRWTPKPRRTGFVKGRYVATREEWAMLRALKLDGWPCRVCLFRDADELHHLCPRSQGGSDVVHNLVPLCSGCHRAVTENRPGALAELRASLLAAEREYAVSLLGQGRFDKRYPPLTERGVSAPIAQVSDAEVRGSFQASDPRSVSGGTDEEAA